MHDPTSPQSWFDKGDNDLATAKIVFSQSPSIRDTVCFHCQQAVEKYLKGYLVYLGISFRLTHDLGYLVDLIEKREPVPLTFLNLADRLEDYGVFGRYPKLMSFHDDQTIEAILLQIDGLRQHFYSKIFP